MADALVELAGIQEWDDLFATYNLGFPLAYAQHNGYAEVNADGANLIDAAWSEFCRILSVNEFEGHISLEEMLA